MLAAAVTLGLCAAPSPSVPQEVWSVGLSVAEIADLYVEVALSDEVTKRKSKLSKWPSDVEVKIYTFPGDSMFNVTGRPGEIVDLVAQVAAQIAAPVGPGRLRAPDWDAMTEMLMGGMLSHPEALDYSIMVTVGSMADLKHVSDKLAATLPAAAEAHAGFLRGVEKRPGPLCYAILSTKPETRYVLYRAWVFVEFTDRLEECLFEELMQTFGLPNDLPPKSPSMFNDDMLNDRPTELDWLLWRIQFDDRLTPGMDENEIRQVLPRILETVRAGG